MALSRYGYSPRRSSRAGRAGCSAEGIGFDDVTGEASSATYKRSQVDRRSKRTCATASAAMFVRTCTTASIEPRFFWLGLLALEPGDLDRRAVGFEHFLSQAHPEPSAADQQRHPLDVFCAVVRAVRDSVSAADA